MFHLYTLPGNRPRVMHWSSEHDMQRTVRSAQREAQARERLTALVDCHGNLGAYGLGRVRSMADYALFSGIDYATRSLAQSARKSRFGY